MAVCPRCESEYEEGITVCADCDVELVSDADAAAGTDEVGETQVAALELETEELAGELRAWLDANGFVTSEPERTDEGTFLVALHGLLPAIAWQKACSDLQLVQEKDEEGFPLYYRRYDPERDRPVDDRSILGEKSLAWLVKNLDESLVEIRQQLLAGNPRWRAVAFQVIGEIGDQGAALLVDVLREGIETGRPRVLRGLITGLSAYREKRGDVPGCPVEQVRRGLAHEDAEVRRLCALAVGHAGWSGLATDLLPLLLDPEPAVQEEADEALIHLFDVDFGFDSDMSAEEKERVVSAWREHLAQ